MPSPWNFWTWPQRSRGWMCPISWTRNDSKRNPTCSTSEQLCHRYTVSRCQSDCAIELKSHCFIIESWAWDSSYSGRKYEMIREKHIGKTGKEYRAILDHCAKPLYIYIKLFCWCRILWRCLILLSVII